MTPRQLNLYRQPELGLTERAREMPPHVHGWYSILLSHVRQLRCAGRVADVGRRRPRSTMRGWSNADVLRLLGLDRRAFRPLEAWGLIGWEGDMLVLPRYHRSAQWELEQEDDRRRRQGRNGGINSGKARRGHLKTAVHSRGNPAREEGGIRSVILNVLADLARTDGSNPLDDLLARRQIGDRGPSDPPLALSEGPPLKNAPSGAPSVSRSTRPASASASTVANRVVRRTAAGGSAGLAAGDQRARLAARTARSPRAVSAAAGPEASKPGGPDFVVFYDWYRKASGKPWRRQEGENVWQAMRMTPQERRWCWQAGPGLLAAIRRKGHATPSCGDFLELHWRPELERRRRDRRRCDRPTEVGDDVAALLTNLKGRRQSR